MKTKCLFLICLFLSFVLFPLNATAQNYSQWSLPEGATARLGKGSISGITFSPDSTQFAVANSVGIWIYNVHTGQELNLLVGHTAPVSSVCYSPDGKTLVSGSLDGTVGVWDVKTGDSLQTLVGSLLLPRGHTKGVLSVCYSPDGKMIAGGTMENTVYLWDVKTGDSLRTLIGPGMVESVCYSPDGKTLAGGDWDGTIQLWDVATGRSLRTFTLTGHTSEVHSVCYSPDGKTIASGFSDDTVQLWDATTGQRLRTFTGYSGNVNSLCYSPDGKTIAGGTGNGTVRLWDTTGRSLRTLTGHTSEVHSVCYSPDGKTIASGASDGTIRLWDVATGRSVRILTGHTSEVHSVCYSPDGKTIASGAWDGVRLWNVTTGRSLRTLTEHTRDVHSVCYSPDGKTLASGGGVWDDGTIRLWDVATGRSLRALMGYTIGVGSVCYSPDGKTIASGAWNGTILLWDARQINRQISTQIVPQSPQTPQTPQQIAKNALASTVLIVMQDARGQPLSTGSGFFVAHGIIATNLHVVEGVFNGYVKRVGMDRTYRIEGIIAMDSLQDLALIKISDVSSAVLPLGSSDKVQVGESVYVAGNPLGFLEGTFSNGIVSGVREFRVGSKRIQITAPVSEGSSGGPVLNSKGEVIGVAVAIITAGQNLNFAIPSNYLSELLNKVKGRK